jgi:hypothetical protein
MQLWSKKQKVGDSYQAQFIAKNFKSDKSIGFLTPKELDHKKPIVQETKERTQYFYFTLTPDLVHRPKKNSLCGIRWGHTVGYFRFTKILL